MHNLTENPIRESTWINLPHERFQLGWNKERVEQETSGQIRTAACVHVVVHIARHCKPLTIQKSNKTYLPSGEHLLNII